MSRHPAPCRVRAPIGLILAAALTVRVPADAAVSGVPPLVFAARRAATGGTIPGVGPAGRAQAAGGRLMLLRPGAPARELLPGDRFFDVAHPSVSWDGRHIVFAATVHPDSAWRLWLADADGGAAHPLTLTPGPGPRVDDLDPCWLADGRVVFASTRYPQHDEAGGGPVTNLFVVAADGSGLRRITTERNGAEKPALDPRDGRVVYARWWHARYLAADAEGGLTLDRAHALPVDRIDLWQPISVLPDGDAPRLAGGHPRRREAQQGYSPVVLGDGTLVAVSAEHAPLAPAPGRLSVVAYAGGFGPRRVLAGAERDAGEDALAPSVLPDGRVLYSATVPGTHDLGLWVIDRDGRGRLPVLHLPGWLALDAAPLVARRAPPAPGAALTQAPRSTPPRTLGELLADPRTFRFDCMNVFTPGAVDDSLPDPPPLTPGARIRFFAALARPASEGGDTLVMFRDSPLTAYGAAHVEDVPADVPVFEQVVDAAGRPLRGSQGPAHTASFNFARAGSGTRCVGCHAGHSTLAVPRNGTSAAFVNAAPSARVSASDSLPGTVGPRAAVDRRTHGPAGEVGWSSAAADSAWLRLDWRMPIEVREIVLYDLPRDAAARTDARLQDCRLELLLGGRVVRRLDMHASGPAGPHRVGCEPTRIDALVVRGLRGRGRVLGVPRVALAEIEAFARMAAP